MKKKYSLFILLGLILGILGGFFLPSVMKDLSFLGTIYINLLKFMIVPIVFTTIMVTMYQTNKLKGKAIIKTVLLFVFMFIVTFLITSLIVFLIKPGEGFVFEQINWSGDSKLSFRLSEIIVNVFPSNIITMFQNNAIFSTIIVALFCGIAATKVKSGKKVIELIEGIKDIFYKLLDYIMYLTPIGVFSLVGLMIADYGKVVLGVGARYIGMAYLCSLIALILIMIIPAWIFAKINPITYIKKIGKVWLVTMTTCSSAATLPTTIKTCNEDLKVPNRITDIVVPLGCTIHMCGGAVSFALLGLFTSQLFGISISLPIYLLMIASATLINMAAPGIPNGGIVIGASYLSLLGIPLTFMGFYSSIYKILDMAYTTLNVTGDITANVIISKYENKEVKD